MSELYKPFQPTLTESGLKRFELVLEYSPSCDILKDVVHSYLEVSAVKPTPYPIIPDGSQAVFISRGGSKISGAQSKAQDVQILQPGEYFGIRFYPGALRHFFNLNVFEITDQFVDDQYFPSCDFAGLHSSIYQCQAFRDRANICEQWLLQYFKPQVATQFDQALSWIYQSSGDVRISQLAARVGWSSRQLNRLFRFHTGLSTKAFSQTIRFQQVCKQLYMKPNDSIAVANDLGFFDQSHLIKGYKKHFKHSPSAFFDRY